MKRGRCGNVWTGGRLLVDKGWWGEERWDGERQDPSQTGWEFLKELGLLVPGDGFAGRREKRKEGGGQRPKGVWLIKTKRK